VGLVDHWVLDGIIVDRIVSGTFDRQLGTEQTVELRFSETGRTAGYKTRYEAVLEYAKYAGEVTYGRQRGGGVWYQEELASAAPVDSLVVPIEPVPWDPGTPISGMWALVTGHSNPNDLPNRLAVDLDVVYLGDADEYADRAAVQSALEEPPL